MQVGGCDVNVHGHLGKGTRAPVVRSAHAARLRTGDVAGREFGLSPKGVGLEWSPWWIDDRVKTMLLVRGRCGLVVWGRDVSEAAVSPICCRLRGPQGHGGVWGGPRGLR
jgi:hypothetical protein